MALRGDTCITEEILPRVPSFSFYVNTFEGCLQTLLESPKNLWLESLMGIHSQWLLPFPRQFFPADTMLYHQTNSGSCRNHVLPCNVLICSWTWKDNHYNCKTDLCNDMVHECHSLTFKIIKTWTLEYKIKHLQRIYIFFMTEVTILLETMLPNEF